MSSIVCIIKINKYFILRGHSVDTPIFHEGLKQKKTIYTQTDNHMYM